MNLLKRWFGLTAPVGRRFYIESGLGLMALRFLGDAAIILVFFGHGPFSDAYPLLYVAPTLLTRGFLLEEMIADSPNLTIAMVAMALWALPYVWVGISMSYRRAKDANLPGWLSLFFFLPIINLLLIALLCCVKSKVSRTPQTIPVTAPTATVGIESKTLLRSALEGIFASAVFGGLVAAASVLMLGDYGYALFVAGPVIMGSIGAFRVNSPRYHGYKAGIMVGLISGAMCFGLLVLFALEGIICLIMLAPLAGGLITIGAILGTALAQARASVSGPVGAMAIMLPLISITENLSPPPLPVYSVVSEIVIDAPPEDVWPNVIGFSELPPAEDWVLNTGIATPMRARIEGEGVGAIRYCEFTTGPFVEPITHWDPPHRLGFDVTSQPPAMQEWSPWEEVYAPHIEDTMLSQRGEFQLHRTESGGTLLRGTTWYTLDLSPSPYWRLWSDMIVHRIHNRVLSHIKTLSEDA